jgi:hypothetical protein
MKKFLDSKKEEVSNEEEAEGEEKRPSQRKQWKGGRQEKRVQFNLPEKAQVHCRSMALIVMGKNGRNSSRKSFKKTCAMALFLQNPAKNEE